MPRMHRCFPENSQCQVNELLAFDVGVSCCEVYAHIPFVKVRSARGQDGMQRECSFPRRQLFAIHVSPPRFKTSSHSWHSKNTCICWSVANSAPPPSWIGRCWPLRQ